MKYQIWSGIDSERTIRLKLVNEGGYVMVVAVDETGEKVQNGNLLTFESDGIYRNASVNNEIGLPLKDGKMKVKN